MDQTVQQYLRGLKWDGVSRVRDLAEQFEHHPGCVTRELALLEFFASAVCRAFEPGCAVNRVLALVGEPGIGKSLFMRRLAGEYTTDIMCPQQTARSMRVLTTAVTTFWIVSVDIAETIQNKLSDDADAFKGFLTARMDSHRPPYARQHVDQARSSVIVLEAHSYGEGPFRHINVVRMTKQPTFDRDQLWAEAVARYDISIVDKISRSITDPR